MKLDLGTIVLLAGIGLGSFVLSNSHSGYSANQHQKRVPRYIHEREALVPMLFEERYAAEEYDIRI